MFNKCKSRAINILGEDNDHGAYLAAGMNCFNFELHLSEFLPSTFLGELGGVQYLSIVAVRYENSSRQLDQVTSPLETANFNVIGISDLNMQPAQIRVRQKSFFVDFYHMVHSD